MTQHPPPPNPPGWPPVPGPAPDPRSGGPAPWHGQSGSGGGAMHAPGMVPPTMWAPPGIAPTQPPAQARTPDPGSRGAGLVAKLILIPVLLLVIVLQQASVYYKEPPAPGTPVIEPRGPEDPGLLMTRLFLKLRQAWGPAISQGGEPLSSIDGLWQENKETPKSDHARDWMAAMDARRYQLEAAIVSAETVGPAEAVERLDELGGRLRADEARLEELRNAPDAGERSEASAGAIRSAAETIEALKGDAVLLAAQFRHVQRQQDDREASSEPAPMGGALDADTWDALIARHGWYARLARVVGAGASDPERTALLGGGQALLGLMTVIVVGLGVVALCSLAASIWLLVKLATRSIRPWFVPPRVGGSVYLEVVALFVLAFLGVQFLGLGLTSIPGMQKYAMEISIGTQWLVLLVIFWPLVRGVGVAQWRRDLGLIAPRGVLREVGAGMVVYFAGLPLLAILGLIGALVLKPIWDDLIKDHVPYTTGGNPIMELVSGGGVLQLVLVYTLATIWAPLVEETVFRGALYRHLRSRLPLLLAGPISALTFGLMHGYEIVLLGPVIALGFTFAFVREWRGSLVGAITMHALHNGTVLLIVILLMRLSA